MLTLPSAVKIFLATKPTDMRKGFDGLAALVKSQLNEDVYSGHLFVFVSRRADRAKILAFDRGGFVLWYKRLERGRFRVPQFSTRNKSISLEASELAMLLDGIDFSRVRRPIRWMPPTACALGIDSDVKS